MKITKYIFFFLSFLYNISAISQETNREIIAKIETKNVSELLGIMGTVSSKTDLIKSLRYQMFIYRKNFQTGDVLKAEKSKRFVLKPNEKITLEEVSINPNTKDKITAVILVFDSENKLVAKDRRVLLNDDENDNSSTKSNKKNDYIGLRGLVTENTKTKPGRDFYVEFYSAYRLKGINGKEVVKIVEQFSFGRSTIMEISVGDKLVHKFFTQPKRDYIKQQTAIAIENVSKYFTILERQKNYIKQY
ncbi:hypothetical protein BTO05_05270 [Winogradskyella sp. PC-19]|uniref:CsgE family curli-type amyloid fiber assembly protein n=1 Tax=unclassified Winogradskyella TaxID=2615021 RepID=UPI000B3C3DDD|nr:MULTISPECIES: CsgE family curli-type amyloid fiber assembly protein [unclassified Winogradskyella]ARV09073.1 hypothetical protein BTO05_05270 [Winogradskyella sp. PC-19]RZN81405.1 MAG: hypothetical protein EVB12_03750 [Winogradskyella sp.]